MVRTARSGPGSLLVPQAIFVALGAEDRSSDWSLVTLADFLAGKRLLLVIDNCEHLMDACAVLVSTLLRSCPDLHVLATSRQALGVVGEVRMPVPPMSLPVDGDEPSAESLANSEAVRLLGERAAAVLPGFAIDDKNAEPVLQLCRRLDGIPLAIELAAVRLGALSLDQLNQGLDDLLAALGSGNRGAEARQQTLEATIDWSYGLLDEAEQVLWARLSCVRRAASIRPPRSRSAPTIACRTSGSSSCSGHWSRSRSLAVS